MKYLIFLSFLPYLRTTPLSSDIQPHFIVLLSMVIFYLALTPQRFPLHAFTLVISSLMIPIGLALNAGVTMISLVLAPIYIDYISRRPKEEFLWGAKAALVVYYIGIVVNIVAPAMLENVVTNFRTSSLRGFNAFTSEPSYLGLVGLSLTVVLVTFGAERRWVLLSILLVFLSGSATAVFPLVIYLGLTFTKGKLRLLIPFLLVGIWVLINYIATTDTRLGNLVGTLLNSPELLFLDLSVSNRIYRGIGPLSVAASEYFIPHDFSDKISLTLSFLSENTDTEIARLSSLGTVFLYGLGWLSFPLIAAYVWVARAPISIWFMIIYLSITNISFATPYLWTVLAIPVVLSRLENSKRRSDKVFGKSEALSPL